MPVNNNKKFTNKKPDNRRPPQHVAKQPVVKKEQKPQGEKILVYKPEMNVSQVAEGLGLSNAAMIKRLMQLGLMASVNQLIDRDTIELIALDEGYEVKDEVITDVTRYDEMEIVDDPKYMVKRPPIVTVMGHVDHGKTTLLDAIRKSRVVEGEAGGITQHIGAYQVVRNGEAITFIDTPGHAAFTEMRARGAKVTDIVVLVVAGDDGVMPQTLEALDHAKAAKVPIIVAVNKMDKQSANPERVMTELAERDLLPEAWGGKTPYVMVSALKRQGIDELLDVIQLISEIDEFKANPKRLAKGTVIEASLDKGRGPVATLIIETGTLHIGDYIVIGNTYGKVRTMTDDLKKRYNEAIPSQPIEVTGLNEVPQAGDIFMAFTDERITRDIALERQSRQRETEAKIMKKASLDKMFGEIESTEKELNIIIKGDVQGSIEALKNLLEKIDIDGFHVNVVRSSVGAITENDVTLANASHAIIIGFNVRPTAAVKQVADQQGVEIRLYNIIYRIQEDIEAALKGMLAPTFEEIITGQAEVRSTFKISKIGTIAGCYVTDGFIKRDALVRVIRDGIVVYEGKLASLKRFKDDAKEVKQGYECGLSIENFNDIKDGDIIEASQMKEVEVD
ncbi:MAG: translation initiation factor IF-2 [Tenericutes bacterium GWC2_34_14]|nr:MAG: translation initiation factor IF-2 [Tenericutes bacterium GWC2_34_14]OHE33862.1 MAG: translation initiation factor IF-2 [Tenericutes bacterium GWE2_34_108]OHE36597.1 MAG: translation initiation factor IF-2 [Tenericutes bacterium GWF1_35_14]OHE37827.1 MAG: translation initiation factor IF-2 [Tenericutes bacterium GWF2_35_184]OHE45282.1 MAG: translation initiation factor IF-2 [Tenericutes bacterium RIFOXYA2_FULL_36_32]OHE45946.1 MAG: translation initiation factor IF-2 [Tenericutes bacter